MSLRQVPNRAPVPDVPCQNQFVHLGQSDEARNCQANCSARRSIMREAGMSLLSGMVGSMPTAYDGGNLAFSPDGKRLVSAAKVWDAQTGEELISLKRLDGISGCVTFSPDGNRLGIVSRFEGQVKIYDATPLPDKP